MAEPCTNNSPKMAAEKRMVLKDCMISGTKHWSNVKKFEMLRVC
jgi:hypothetical protein